jgi:predicted DNA-binding helix-hairpin-helix protein
MESMQKLKLLSLASENEVGEDGCRITRASSMDGIILTYAALPNGKTTTLLKSLLTSVCENNCFYCPMRSARDFRRTTFQPDNFAQLVVNLTNAGLIQGVFLSSGIAGGGVRTQNQLIKTAHILRTRMQYLGYIHLKIMPEAQFEQILASMRLADRVSINLEAPNSARLPALAPKKDFERDLMEPIRVINHIRNHFSPSMSHKQKWPSSSTQFVVGGANESDQELLSTSQLLHKDFGLRRIYYSAFTPHQGTPFAAHAPVPSRREVRLYQADFLIRDYGFSENELAYDETGCLPLQKDPKMVWAERFLYDQPIEINQASREELLRVPGIGPKHAQTILQFRKIRTITDLSFLKKIGVSTNRVKDFILLNGKLPTRQLSLFQLDHHQISIHL